MLFLPFVSGMYAMINAAQDKQTPTNANIVLWNPNVSVKSGRNFTTRNCDDHNIIIQNEGPKFFNFSGMTSEMTKNGRVNTPNDAMKITNEKLAIGTQLNDSTSYPDVFSIIYIANEESPNAMPIDDIMYKN